MKLTVHTDGLDGFANARWSAQKMDHREKLKPEKIVCL